MWKRWLSGRLGRSGECRVIEDARSIEALEDLATAIAG